MIYIYNMTNESYSTHRSLNPDDYPINASMLRKTIDHIVNDIEFNELSESFQKIWMEDKFAYVSWVRDKLIQYHK